MKKDILERLFLYLIMSAIAVLLVSGAIVMVIAVIDIIAAEARAQSSFCEMFCPVTPAPTPVPEPKPVPKPEPAPQGCDEKDEICQIESLILDYTNDVRARNGKPALVGNYKIAYGAREWSKDQADQGQISHTGFPGAREADIKARYGEVIKIRAENVAMNWSTRYRSPEDIAKKFVFEQWEKSPPHFKAMIGNYKELGVGVAVKNGSYYATQNFR